MLFEDIYSKMCEHKNDAAAEKMAAYMKDKFPFLGVKTPQRRAVCKESFKQAKTTKVVDWELINNCWENEYREMQYVAVDYLAAMQKYLVPEDIGKIKLLAQTKAWWDTIDGLAKVVGYMALKHSKINDTLLQWSGGQDLWLRRIAIIHQLLRKENTDTVLLEKVLAPNLGSNEFFINKAIGWALRDYSKTDPQWVRRFISQHQNQLASLSVKEASKYI